MSTKHATSTIGSSETRSLSRKRGHPLVLVVTGVLLCWAQAGCGDPRLRSDWYGCSEDAGLGCPVGMVCLTVPDGGGEQRCYDKEPSCGPGSCPGGCCDPNDECREGDQDQLCGNDGAACEDCTSTAGGFCSGQTCQSSACVDSDGDGYGVDCTLGPDACDGDDDNWTASGCASCTDVDGDGVRGTGCDSAEDACDGDEHNWTVGGCASCTDVDGDGVRGTGCDSAEDACDDDEHNWTVGGCTGCMDTDGDGYGTDCDLGPDCDDGAPGIAGECQANGCPEGWAHIPAGELEMGCNDGELDGTCQINEQPRHTVTLTAYCLEVTEVSVEAYRACKAAGVCTGTPTPTDDNEYCNWSASPGSREAHPINGITWSESTEYCQSWLGGDLPTEAQWEKGARGGSGDTRKYPWGASPEPDCTRCNFDENGSAVGYGCNTTTPPYTWEVGHLTGPAGDSPYGLKDMTGNVLEWVQDWYRSDFYSSCPSGCTNPLNTDSASGNRVLRGGGFNYTANDLRVVTRKSRVPTLRNNYIGFRCRRTP